MRLVGGELDDAVPQPDVLRPLARRAEEDLRRRGVRILLQEVMLHLPGIVVAEPVGELDLGERVLDELILATLLPRPRELMFVEDAELPGASASRSEVRRVGKACARTCMYGSSLYHNIKQRHK